ncbi:COX assembly mitochondrial protein 2 homolog [Condylostylus longicornis]|uniref:COX assembly mitochondrial protein 2 homolog n=1 Tax=Condylostylus longicornis TaxID=2530218 RepID=UPI00244E2BDD|nr:COX assembly mitochondrial protein 2 homolog [Condylostylus longicornis]XP_055385228.1 COX assembly mitochondrial protein 2 homolog [Condylostylus longicornis]
MHPDLSPHLHTPECNRLIDLLKACHTENKFLRFVGQCNEIDRELWRCLKKEREENIRNNRRKAQEKHQRIREKIKEAEKIST